MAGGRRGRTGAGARRVGCGRAVEAASLVSGGGLLQRCRSAAVAEGCQQPREWDVRVVGLREGCLLKGGLWRCFGPFMAMGHDTLLLPTHASAWSGKASPVRVHAAQDGICGTPSLPHVRIVCGWHRVVQLRRACHDVAAAGMGVNETGICGGA